MDDRRIDRLQMKINLTAKEYAQQEREQEENETPDRRKEDDRADDNGPEHEYAKYED